MNRGMDTLISKVIPHQYSVTMYHKCCLSWSSLFAKATLFFLNKDLIIFTMLMLHIMPASTMNKSGRAKPVGNTLLSLYYQKSQLLWKLCWFMFA